MNQSLALFLFLITFILGYIIGINIKIDRLTGPIITDFTDQELKCGSIYKNNPKLLLIMDNIIQKGIIFLII